MVSMENFPPPTEAERAIDAFTALGIDFTTRSVKRGHEHRLEATTPSGVPVLLLWRRDSLGGWRFHTGGSAQPGRGHVFTTFDAALAYATTGCDTDETAIADPSAGPASRRIP